MSIERARQLLGKEFINVPDSTIEQMIQTFGLIANIVIDQHLQERD
jgi:cyanophycinase-like exopeptidase